jgi:hypothetical protein
VDPAKGVAGEEVVEEDSVVAVVVAVVVEVVEVAAVEAVVVEEGEANRWQQQQPPTHLKMDLREYHPPFSKEIPRCLICSNRNGDYTEPPMSIMMT